MLPDSDGSPNPFEDPYTAPCQGSVDHVYTEMCKPYVEMTGLNQEDGVEIVVPTPVHQVTYYKTIATTTSERPGRPDTPSPSLLRGAHRISLSPALNCSGKRTSPESPIGEDRGVESHLSSLREVLGPVKMARKQGCSIGCGRDGFALDRTGNDVSRNCLPGGSYTQ